MCPTLLQISSAHTDVPKLARRMSQRRGVGRRRSRRGRVSQAFDMIVGDVIILIIYDILNIERAPAYGM
jgi:hypothetical protein